MGLHRQKFGEKTTVYGEVNGTTVLTHTLREDESLEAVLTRFRSVPVLTTIQVPMSRSIGWVSESGFGLSDTRSPSNVALEIREFWSLTYIRDGDRWIEINEQILKKDLKLDESDEVILRRLHKTILSEQAEYEANIEKFGRLQ